MQLARTDNEIDPGGTLPHQLLVFLRHAAEHTNDQIRPLRLLCPHAAKGRVDLVFRMLTHTAGVVEDSIGLRRAGGYLPALPAQGCHHELAVEHVHLAAHGVDPESASHAADSKAFFSLVEGSRPTTGRLRRIPADSPLAGCCHADIHRPSSAVDLPAQAAE